MIVNFLMVVEVSTRWIAYGKVCVHIVYGSTCSLTMQKYPMTLLNLLDLGLVLFCVVTLILVFANPCAEGTTRR